MAPIETGADEGTCWMIGFTTPDCSRTAELKRESHMKTLTKAVIGLSAAGAAYATMAISAAVEPKRARR